MNVLDPEYRKRYELIVAQATKVGKDPLEMLNSYGMLATTKFTQDTTIRTLENLWRRLDDKSAASILTVYTGKGSGTPEDMYRAIQEWLEAVINAMTKGEVTNP